MEKIYKTDTFIKYTFGKINLKKFHLLGITTSRCEVEFVFGSKDEVFLVRISSMDGGCSGVAIANKAN